MAWVILYIWFETEGVVEYFKMCKLKFTKYKEFEDFRKMTQTNINFPDFLLCKYSNFLTKLINCPMCTGFWVGLFFGIITDYRPPLILGGLVSLLSWIVYTITYYFSIKSEWYQIQVTSDQEENSNNENIAEDDKDA